MSEHRDKMKRRMGFRGENSGESKQRNAFELVNKTFDQSPTYRRAGVIANWQPDLTEIDLRVINIERMGDIRELLFRPYESVEVGTYLTFDDDIWLVYDKFGFEGKGKTKALVERCTEKLRWQDRDGLYREEYCIASATQLGSRANQGKNALEWNKFDVRLPLGQVFVFVQKTDETNHLHLSQRFILGSNAYEITGYDDVTSTRLDGKGYIQLTMSLTIKHEGDDFENGIAFNNYGPPPVEGTDEGAMW